MYYLLFGGRWIEEREYGFYILMKCIVDFAFADDGVREMALGII